MRKSLLVATLAALSTLAAATAVTPAWAQARTDLNIGIQLEPTTLDPTTGGAAAAIRTVTDLNIYNGLTRLDKDGKAVKISDFAGKFLLVNFWASWCIPCRAEMPALDKLAQQQNDDSFMVLPINTGETQAGKAKEFFTAGGWTHLPLYIDPNFTALERLKTTAVALGLPTTLLLDKKGCEIGVLQGPAVWDSPDGARVIEALKSI